jgi:cholesterol oxidase
VRDAYDCIVIGSGFGGAVVACRLAQAGRSVAVLERGKRWAGGDFPRSIGEVGADAFWEEGRSHGFLEYAAFRNVDVIQGAGVGGGSLHYFNVNLPAEPRIFADRRWPAAINRDILDPYYQLAREMLGSSPLTPPPERSRLPPRTTAFVDAARRAGLETDLVPLAVHAAAARPRPATGLVQNPCNYSGNCLFGCDIGAKNTLDLNYLALAEHRHGAEILPLHVAESIVPLPEGGYEVHFRRLDPNPTEPGTPGTLRAARVVVAAGSLGSTALLLRCRDRDHTLAGLSPALGTHFSLNGEFLFARAYDITSRADPGIGPPITARATVSTPEALITVEDLGLPDQLLWYLEGTLPPPLGRLRGMAVLAAGYLKRALGLGSPTSKLSLELDAVLAGARTPHTIPYLGMGTDSSDGELVLREGGLELNWSVWRNRALYAAIEDAMRRISEAAGGRFATSFLYRWPMRKLLTAHPLGGCAMGDDQRTSVVNDRGEVWGHPGLYVVDGSMIPTALAVNPSLTIAALAERAAFWMVHGRELAAGDAETPTRDIATSEVTS